MEEVFMGLGALFLLSTGDDRGLEVVSGWMKELAASNKNKVTAGDTPGMSVTAGLRCVSTIFAPVTSPSSYDQVLCGTAEAYDVQRCMGR